MFRLLNDQQQPGQPPRPGAPPMAHGAPPVPQGAPMPPPPSGGPAGGPPAPSGPPGGQPPAPGGEPEMMDDEAAMDAEGGPAPPGGGGDIAATLMQRFKAMPPQDAAAFISGTNREAIEALSRAIPELSGFFDEVIRRHGGGAQAAPGEDLPLEEGGGGPQAGGMPAQQSPSRLASIS